MSEAFDHLHLKRNTAGSSNELSFDVLDAARSGDASRKGKTVFGKSPATSQNRGSYHGVKGTTTFSGLDEVKQRKKKRSSRMFWIRALIAFLIVAALSVVGLFAFRYYQSVQGFSAEFDAVIDEFSTGDEFLATVDSAMDNLANNGESDGYDELIDTMPEIHTKYSQLNQKAREIMPFAVDESDKTAINKVSEAISARQEMLSTAQNALESAIEKDAALKEASSIWEKVVAADQTAQEATALSNAADTEEEIGEAQEKTKQAYDLMTAARDKLVEFVAQYDKIDFAAQEEYIDMKLKSLEAALAMGEALIAGDKDAAQDKMTQYNDWDKKAANKASELPMTLDDTVKKPYVEQERKYLELYGAARDRVVTTDALIRSYLG